MKKNFFIVSFLIFIVPNICLSYSNDPKQFITEIVNEAKQILDSLTISVINCFGSLLYERHILGTIKIRKETMKKFFFINLTFIIIN
jgi:hypothetical protein